MEDDRAWCEVCVVCGIFVRIQWAPHWYSSDLPWWSFCLLLVLSLAEATGDWRSLLRWWTTQHKPTRHRPTNTILHQQIWLSYQERHAGLGPPSQLLGREHILYQFSVSPALDLRVEQLGKMNYLRVETGRRLGEMLTQVLQVQCYIVGIGCSLQ